MLRRSDMPAIRIFLPERITPKILEHRGSYEVREASDFGGCLAGFPAGGDRCVAVRPVAPGAGVEAAAVQAGDLHRQEVVRRVDTGAAVEDRAVVSSQPRKPGTQLGGRFEPTVGSQVLHPRRAQGSRDVARLGIDRLRLAAIALAGSRVEQ